MFLTESGTVNRFVFLSGNLLKGRNKNKNSVDRNCAFVIGDVLTKKICVVYLTEIVRV